MPLLVILNRVLWQHWFLKCIKNSNIKKLCDLHLFCVINSYLFYNDYADDEHIYSNNNVILYIHLLIKK